MDDDFRPDDPEFDSDEKYAKLWDWLIDSRPFYGDVLAGDLGDWVTAWIVTRREPRDSTVEPTEAAASCRGSTFGIPAMNTRDLSLVR